MTQQRHGSQPNDDRAGRRRGRRVGGHGRADARDGRRPGHRPRRARLVSRNLGDDDRRDDAALGGACGATRRATRLRVPTVLFMVGYLAVWTAYGLVAYARLPARDLVRSSAGSRGTGRPVRRRRRDRRRRHLRADAAEAAEPAPLPKRSARRKRVAERSCARPRLRRLFGRSDGGALRARCDEPLLDGGRRRRDLRGEGSAARAAARARVRSRARCPRDRVAVSPASVPGLTEPGGSPSMRDGSAMNLPPVVSADGMASSAGRAPRQGEGSHAGARRARRRAPPAAAGPDREGVRLRRPGRQGRAARPVRGAQATAPLPLHVRAEPGRGLRRLLDVRRPGRPPRPPARSRHVVRTRVARPDRRRSSRTKSGWAGRFRGSRRSRATSTSTSASGRRRRSRTSTRTARRSASASSCATATASFARTSRRPAASKRSAACGRFLDLTPLGRQEEWEDSPAGYPQTKPYEWWRRHDEYEGT